MSINKSELLKNVKLACDNQIPLGIEHAWEDTNGNVVKWSDIRQVLQEALEGDDEAPVKTSKKKVEKDESEQ